MSNSSSSSVKIKVRLPFARSTHGTHLFQTKEEVPVNAIYVKKSAMPVAPTFIDVEISY